LYTFVDTDVIDGYEYTYSVTAYDMGVSGSDQTFNDDGTLSTTYIANPDEWANPKGYQSIETSRGTTVYDPNFVVIVPGYKPNLSPSAESLKEVRVVPNPYIVASPYAETEYLSQLQFVHLPEEYKITIYTITGEKVFGFDQDDYDAGVSGEDQHPLPCRYITLEIPLDYLLFVNPTNESLHAADPHL
jgi:hypothetical protein